MCQRQPQARAARAAGPHQQDRHSETPNRRVVRLEAQTPTAMQFIQDNSKQGIALRAQNNRKGNNSNQKHTEHTHTHTHTHTSRAHKQSTQNTHGTIPATEQVQERFPASVGAVSVGAATFGAGVGRLELLRRARATQTFSSSPPTDLSMTWAFGLPLHKAHALAEEQKTNQTKQICWPLCVCCPLLSHPNPNSLLLWRCVLQWRKAHHRFSKRNQLHGSACQIGN